MKKLFKVFRWVDIFFLLVQALVLLVVLGFAIYVIVWSCSNSSDAVEEVTQSPVNIGRILVRPCPKCKGTIIEQNRVVSCRDCNYKKDWNKER